MNLTKSQYYELVTIGRMSDEELENELNLLKDKKNTYENNKYVVSEIMLEDMDFYHDVVDTDLHIQCIEVELFSRKERIKERTYNELKSMIQDVKMGSMYYQAIDIEILRKELGI